MVQLREFSPPQPRPPAKLQVQSGNIVHRGGAYLCDPGPSKIRNRKEKTLPSIQCRMSPTGLLKFVTDVNLSQQQKKDIEEIGFGELLHMRASCNQGELGYWLVDNFKPISKKLYLCEDMLEITATDFHLSLGLPMVRRKVEESAYIHSDIFKSILEAWSEQFPNVKYSDVTTSMLLAQLTSQRQGGVMFKRNFVVFVVSSLLNGYTNNRVNFRVLNALADVSAIKNMNWCEYGLRSLVDASLKWQDEGKIGYFSGPLVPFMFIYLDRVIFKYRELPRVFPTMKSWTQVEINKRVNQEKQAGGFGKGSVDKQLDHEIASTPLLPEHKKDQVSKIAKASKALATAFSNFVLYLDDARESFPNSEIVGKMHSLSRKMIELYATFEVSGNGLCKGATPSPDEISLSQEDPVFDDPKFWEAIDELVRSFTSEKSIHNEGQTDLSRDANNSDPGGGVGNSDVTRSQTSPTSQDQTSIRRAAVSPKKAAIPSVQQHHTGSKATPLTHNQPMSNKPSFAPVRQHHTGSKATSLTHNQPMTRSRTSPNAQGQTSIGIATVSPNAQAATPCVHEHHNSSKPSTSTHNQPMTNRPPFSAVQQHQTYSQATPFTHNQASTSRPPISPQKHATASVLHRTRSKTPPPNNVQTTTKNPSTIPQNLFAQIPSKSAFNAGTSDRGIATCIEAPSFSLGLSQSPQSDGSSQGPVTRSSKRASEFQDDAICKRQQVPVRRELPKRQVGIGQFNKSPYWSRHKPILSRLNQREQRMIDFIFFGDNPNHDYEDNSFEMACDDIFPYQVVDLWSHLMNQREQFRGSNSSPRFFSTLKTFFNLSTNRFGHVMYHNFKNCLDDDFQSAKHITPPILKLMFFPAYEDSHFLICINFFVSKIQLLDVITHDQVQIERRLSKAKFVVRHIVRYLTEKNMRVDATSIVNFKYDILKMPFMNSNIGHNDSVVYVMRFMETFYGVTSVWDIGIKKASESFAARMRTTFCYQIATARSNLKHGEVSEKALKFAESHTSS